MWILNTSLILSPTFYREAQEVCASPLKKTEVLAACWHQQRSCQCQSIWVWLYSHLEIACHSTVRKIIQVEKHSTQLPIFPRVDDPKVKVCITLQKSYISNSLVRMLYEKTFDSRSRKQLNKKKKASSLKKNMATQRKFVKLHLNKLQDFWKSSGQMRTKWRC